VVAFNLVDSLVCAQALIHGCQCRRRGMTRPEGTPWPAALRPNVVKVTANHRVQ